MSCDRNQRINGGVRVGCLALLLLMWLGCGTGSSISNAPSRTVGGSSSGSTSTFTSGGSTGGSSGGSSGGTSSSSLTITSVSISNITDTTVTVNWQTTNPSTSQVFFGDTTSYEFNTAVDSTLVTNHSQTLTNLTANTSYHYQVRSVDGSNHSASSADATFITSAPLPPSGATKAFSSIAAVSVTTNSATITWTSNFSGTSQVEYGTTTSLGSLSALNASLATSHSVPLTGLVAGTVYHYRVHSKDASGIELVSSDMTFATVSMNLSNISVGSILSNSAIVSWTSNVAGTSQVEYGTTTAYGQATAADATLVTTHSQPLTNLLPGTTYHYRVHTIDGAGNQAVSADSTFVTTQGLTLSSVGATSLTANSAVIIWTSNVPASSQIEYGTTSAYGSTTTLDTTLTTSHSEAVAGLTASTTYHYRVHSQDATGNSVFSTDATFTTTATTPPLVISSVAAAPVTATGATITWTTNNAADSQVDYGTTTAYGSSTTLDATLTLAHSQAITGLTPSTLYHYRVRSTDASSSQLASPDATFTTPALPALAISNVASSGVTTTGATITWTTNNAADSQVQYGTTTAYGLSTVLDSSQVTSHSQALSGLTVATLYHYRVLSTDASGTQQVSADFTLTTATPQAITISGVNVTGISATTANVNWTTSGPGTSQVEYGTTASYGSTTTLDSTLATSHSQQLTGLMASTTYHYRVHSKDSGGTEVISSDSTFSTAAAGGTTSEDIDWTQRSSSAGVVRSITFSGNLPVWTGSPVGAVFPDAWHNNGFATYDATNTLLSTGGSIQFSQPADGTDNLASVADNGGSAWFNVEPDTSVTFGSGSEFYIQWRSKKSPGWMAYNDATQGEQFKDYILSFSDRYIDSSNWASMYDCSAGEIVQVDNQRTLMPVLYYGCGAMAGKRYQNLFPFRSSQYIDQTGPGCLHNATVNTPSVAISSIQRIGGVVTVVTSSAHGLSSGAEVRIYNVPMADKLSTNNTSFDGVFTITVDNSTQFHYTQAGVDQGPLNVGNVGKINRSKCWTYQPDEWATYQLHVKVGSDYDIDNNYHRDTTIELWAAHENQPSVLITSLTDYDMVMHEDGNDIQTAAPSVSGTAGRQAWWTNHGLQPAYGRMELMQYLSNRCALAHSVSAVARSGSTSTVYFAGNRNYNNGAGSQCVNVGDQLVVAGTTIDGGSFNGTWTVTTSSSYWATFTQSGNAVAQTADVGTVSLPYWNINCLGGPCVVNQNVDEVIWSTKRIPDPQAGVGSPLPDPPDNLIVSAVNSASGDVTLQWRCNDTDATGYKIDTCAADRYQCAVNTGLGTGAQWTNATTVAKTCSTYGTQSATYSIGNNSTLMSFRVHATNSTGDSTSSNAAQNTPGQPMDVTATANSSTQVTVNWTPATPALQTAFVVERCTGTANKSPCVSNTETNWTVVCGASVPAGSTSCVDSTATTGTTYTYRVKAVNNAGETLPWGGDPAYSLAYGGNTARSQVTTP